LASAVLWQKEQAGTLQAGQPEIGQLLFVAVFMPALMWLSCGRGARPTPRIASLAAAVIGTYWLVQRIFLG
jgi:hypothetical protein